MGVCVRACVRACVCACVCVKEIWKWGTGLNEKDKVEEIVKTILTTPDDGKRREEEIEQEICLANNAHLLRVVVGMPRGIAVHRWSHMFLLHR